MKAVQVMLELGHRAVIRDQVTAEGYTHDWCVFVRGPDNNAVDAFIEKVVFQLHESFPKPKRVKHDPPYEVRESGYAGFLLPITVHFKSKETVTFNHDLVLQNDQPTTNVRKEKLTFQSPADDFRKLLFRGGGVSVSPQEASRPRSPHDRPVSYGGKGRPPASAAAPAQSDRDERRSKTSSGWGGSSSGGATTPTPSKAKHQDKKSSDKRSGSEKKTSHKPGDFFVNLFGQPIKKTSHVSPSEAKKSRPSPAAPTATTAGVSTSRPASETPGKERSAHSTERREKNKDGDRDKEKKEKGREKKHKDKEERHKHREEKHRVKEAKEKEKEKERERQREKEKEKEREKEKEKERDKEKEREKVKEKEKHRLKKEREKRIEEAKEKKAEKEKQKALEKEKILERESLKKEKALEREKIEKEKALERQRALEKESALERERQKEAARASEKERIAKEEEQALKESRAREQKAHELPATKPKDRSSVKKGTKRSRSPSEEPSKKVKLEDVKAESKREREESKKRRSLEKMTASSSGFSKGKPVDNHSGKSKVSESHSGKVKDKSVKEERQRSKPSGRDSVNGDRVKDETKRSGDDDRAERKQPTPARSAEPPSAPPQQLKTDVRSSPSAVESRGRHADPVRHKAAKRRKHGHSSPASKTHDGSVRSRDTAAAAPPSPAPAAAVPPAERPSPSPDHQPSAGSGGSVLPTAGKPCPLRKLMVEEAISESLSDNSSSDSDELEALPPPAVGAKRPSGPSPRPSARPQPAAAEPPAAAAESAPTLAARPDRPDLSIYTTEYLAELQELQRRIMTSQDRDELSRVFDLIWETGQVEDGANYYDFDLCALDQSVVRKLQRCLLMV